MDLANDGTPGISEGGGEGFRAQCAISPRQLGYILINLIDCLAISFQLPDCISALSADVVYGITKAHCAVLEVNKEVCNGIYAPTSAF